MTSRARLRRGPVVHPTSSALVPSAPPIAEGSPDGEPAADVDVRAWRAARGVGVAVLATSAVGAIAIAVRVGMCSLFVTVPLGLAAVLATTWLVERVAAVAQLSRPPRRLPSRLLR